MTTPPPCRRVGRQCRSLAVTLRVAELTDSEASGDHEATWLLGHTQHIDFGTLEIDGPYLTVKAVLHVPCRHAQRLGTGAIRCQAHGYVGQVPVPRRTPADPKLGAGRFALVERGRQTQRLLAPAPVRRSLPVLAAGPNPCAVAPCRTADNARGAACCRDLQLEIICPPRSRVLESLIRSRRSPYLCKIEREDESSDSLGVEMISACAYLAADGVACSLHGLARPDGRTAKPDLCFQWPKGQDSRHPGCVF